MYSDYTCPNPIIGTSSEPGTAVPYLVPSQLGTGTGTDTVNGTRSTTITAVDLLASSQVLQLEISTGTGTVARSTGTVQYGTGSYGS